MAKSPFNEPPDITDKESFREYMLNLHNHVYGLGDDVTGTLNIADNLFDTFVNTDEDEIITGYWTIANDISITGDISGKSRAKAYFYSGF